MNYQKESLDRDDRFQDFNNGRAQWRESSGEVEIIVPAISPIGIRLFVSAWLVFWFFGFITGTFMMLKGIDHGFAFIFILVWLGLWLLGGYFVSRMVWWMWFGKEHLLFRSGELRIERVGAWFSKPATYDLSKALRFRAQEESGPYNGFNRRGVVYKLGDSGTMRFDYGMKTIKFGIGLEEAEARVLLERLANKGFLPADKILP